jgi:tetratricopeptide (TPR) repeat protein
MMAKSRRFPALIFTALACAHGESFASDPAALLAAGRFADAIPMLQQHVAATPAADGDWEKLADLHDWLGDLPAAQSDLRHAIANNSESATVANRLFRLAILALDARDTDGAIAAMDRAVSLEPAKAPQAGLICALFGRYDDACRYLTFVRSADPRWQLLAGNIAMHVGQLTTAINAFTTASDSADTPALKRYCAERLVTAHRQQKTEKALATAWLADKTLPADRWTALVILLRDAGRIDDLLAYWDRISSGDGQSQPSLQLANRVVTAARYAGKTDQAKAICLRMLARNPDDSFWLKFTARAMCDWGDTAGAADLLNQRLNLATDAEQLRQLAIIGRDLGLKDLASAAAVRLTGFDNRTRVQGLLLQADIDSRQNDDSDANVLLTQAAKAAETNPSSAVDVAGALEFAGRLDDAIALLSKTVSPNDYEQRHLLAELLAKQRQFSEAAKQFELLRAVAPTDALRAQASLELLDTATTAGTLPQLITNLQATLSKGTGTVDDVTILANALVRGKRLADALSLLQSTPLLDEKARLNQTAVLLLRAKRRTDAEVVLQKLVEVDPQNAVDHLEELASAYTADRDLKKADSAVDAIRARLGSDSAAATLMGNIFDRLNRPADAEICYEKVITQQPDNENGWIAWSGAATRAGDGLRARQRLQALAHQTGSDALFCTAVDAILNQKPPAFVSQSLRREALYRLSLAPQSLLLWQVVADLSDELNDPAFVRRSIETALPFNDDQRDQRVRDLMAATAGEASQIDAAVGIGQSMQLLGDHFPPQDYIDLGTALLNAHRPADALPALQQAVAETTEDRVTLHVVDLLARFQQFPQAIAIGSPLLRRHQFDADIQLNFAGLNEAAGNNATAFQQYRSAIQLYAITPKSNLDGAQSQDRSMAQSLDGAIATAQSHADIDQLLAESPWLTAEVFARAGLDTPSHRSASTRPVGNEWSENLAADVKSGFVRFPDDPKYVEMRIAIALSLGNNAAAHEMAAHFPPASSTATDRTLLIRAALAGNDANLADRFALEPLRAAIENPSASANMPIRLNPLTNLISNAWTCLNRAGQLQLQSILESDIQSAADPSLKRIQVKSLLVAAALTGQSVKNAGQLALVLVDPKNPDTDAIARLLLLLPAAEQPAFLSEAAAKIPEQSRLSLYLTTVELAHQPLSDGTVAAIQQAIAQLPAQNRVIWNAWCSNPAQANCLGQISDALSAKIPAPRESLQSIAPIVACALALAESGRTADADAKVELAISHLRPWQNDGTVINKDYFAYEQLKPGDPPPRAYLLKAALSALSPTARKCLDTELSKESSDDVAKSKQTPEQSAWELLVQSLVKQSLGEQRESLALLRQSFLMNRTDPSVRKFYSEWLFDQGHDQELLESFNDVFTAAQADRRVLGLVMQSARHLYRMSDNYQPSDVAEFHAVPNFALMAAMGDSTALVQSMDRLLQDLRISSLARSDPAWSDPPLGGLSEQHTSHAADMLSSDPAAMKVLLANWPIAAVRSSAWTKDLLSRGLACGTINRKDLLERLSDHASQKPLNDADRDLLALVAAQRNDDIPPELIDDAWQATAIKPEQKQFNLLAELNRPSPSDASQMWQVPHAGVLIGTLPDASAASFIRSKLQEHDPSVAYQEMRSLTESGSIAPQSARMQVFAARIAAEQGDLEMMRLRIRGAIAAWKSQPPPSVVSNIPMRAPELEQAVPDPLDSPVAAAAFTQAIKTEIESALVRWPGDSELVASLAKTGGRLANAGYPDQAKLLLRAGLTANEKLCDGDQTLCMADLAERLNDSVTSQELQLQCLRSRCLPVGRIATVMAKVEPAQRKELLNFLPGNLPARLLTEK